MEVIDRNRLVESTKQSMLEAQQGGFSFDLYQRNESIVKTLGGKASAILPHARKTGTTIVGILFADGVVLGADTRATDGSEVADKNCEKIHYIAPNIYCCGAGTAADTEKTTELIASNLELLRLSTNTQSRVVTALTQTKRLLYRYQGNVSAALILGGVDVHGPHLYSIHPHGSTQRLPYTTMGSGSLAAMAVFETRFREDMNEQEAVELVRDSIRAGILNDLGSGSNVDITVIKKDGTVARHRTYEETAGRAEFYRKQYQRPEIMNIPLGATFVIEESFKPHRKGPAPLFVNNPNVPPPGEVGRESASAVPMEE
jgi:20S proteasome subunit beta 2